ncbi:THxN family PEP-CTERM protein [Phenylobacterium sp.]|uniref:THxN family PEP-CTERM protein n=1 Tax=Phenylobacterium sp. TaxID=1871053 RepID=UPI0035B46146
MQFNVKSHSIALAAAAALSAGAFAAPAAAATVEFSNITGTWSNATPSYAVNYSGNGTANAKATWGGGNKPSGYTFQGISPTSVNINGPGSYGPVDLGNFTHNNWPISGSSITSLKLAIKMNVKIGAQDLGQRTFNFAFNHWETDNDPFWPRTPCANGQSQSSSINSNGCADRVTVTSLNDSQTFEVDGALYTLDFAGFLSNGQQVSEFWTKEKANNTAMFQASIKMVQSAVPEPSTWAMMIVGFGAAGAMVRSSRRRGALAA